MTKTAEAHSAEGSLLARLIDAVALSHRAVARRRAALRAVLIAATMALAIQSGAPQSAVSATTWHYDMYDASGVRYQDPDYTACVAASTQMMLNMIFDTGTKDFELRQISPQDRFIPSSGPVFMWQPSISYATQESVLKYERAHMTMTLSSPGTDAHGWRNGLNYFGWGDINSGFYADRTFTSFDAAAKAVVRSIALYGKPAGILGWYGGHAQFVTGYTVTGADPRTGSTVFSVTGIYLTDPLRTQAMRDKWLSYNTWRYSVARIAFKQYWQKDAPFVDPIDGRVGNAEWYGRWVAVLPTR